MRRKGRDGSGMLGQWRTTVGREQVSEKLDLGHSKFTLGKADGQPMLTTKEEDFAVMVYVGGEILAEKDIIHIDETVLDSSDVERCFLHFGGQKACTETQTFQRE